jgi:hypothetical protein
MLPVVLILSAAIRRIIRSHRRLVALISFSAPVLALPAFAAQLVGGGCCGCHRPERGDGWESNPPRTPQQRPANGFEDPWGRVEFRTGPKGPLTQRSINRLGARRIVFQRTLHFRGDRKMQQRGGAGSST